MSDIIDDLLRLSEDPNVDPRCRRRQTMERLVETLLAMADAEIGPEEVQHRYSIIHLTTIIRDMTGRIAEADDTTICGDRQGGRDADPQLAAAPSRRGQIYGALKRDRYYRA